MSAIDQETNHPCQISYDAGFAAGKNLARSGADESQAASACRRGERGQEDSEAYCDGFWEAYHDEA